MTVNKITQRNLELASQRIQYQNKQQEIKRLEEKIRQEKLRLEKLKPVDPTKGNNVDVNV